eukprot:TRINITY_DN10628_c0_g1_i1.p1 TRINITY_DN10628_c0_g1~~TRINITY_DN10628_c0_g1_i1.p1  ORF type:complete len:510 (+),score=147.77 TRINITY_DN10628_c0_g1_i1:186-1532(+)
MSAPTTEDLYDTTEEGKIVLTQGSPEARLFGAIPEGGIKRDELVQVFGNSLAPAQGAALKNGWIEAKKEGTGKEAIVFLHRKATEIVDTAKEDLTKIVVEGQKVTKELDYLVKRKWLVKKSIKVFSLDKGAMFGKIAVKAITEITADMLSSWEQWENTPFKINFDALGKAPNGGHLHPLQKVRQEFRHIFLELGYEEMPTNKWVESSFWNFDSLFQPQQHPARDMHDTFFLEHPKSTLTLPEDYVARVREMHETGGHGSIGWRYEFSDEEMRKNVLRTHTTAVSSRMLYKLAEQETFKPMKYFSIDRVFRNETVDSTHLAEFHQIEGLVADYDITLTNLMGSIKEFFARIGIHELRFKPAYNPYTEPSMEIFGYHPLKKTWMEIGNSGIFRPEMLLPMGLPPNVSVAAWGLSLERPTMIMYGYSKIASLVGHKVDLKMINTNPIPRFA